MEVCTACPHQNDCLKTGACLDELNAPQIAANQFPERMTPAQASQFMEALRAERTLRRICGGGEFGPAIASLTKFHKHCGLYPAWGAEAKRLAAANAKAADRLKGGGRSNLTHCKRGHSLADAFIHISPEGWVMRNCRTCHEARRDRIQPLPPAKLQQVKALLIAKKSIADITGQHLRGKKRAVIVNSKQFYSARKADPEFDLFVKQQIVGSNARAQQLRQSLNRTHRTTQEQREQANEYRTIRALFPAWIPNPDELVSRIFEDILSGALDRSDVPKRVQFYSRERERLFPTKFRKFGDGLLVSLDEVMFDTGSATRGDTVSRGLWD